MQDQLYEKVKIVVGEKFATIENTKVLTEEELLAIIASYANHPAYKELPNLSILVNDKFSSRVDQFSQQHHFQLHDELIIFEKILEQEKTNMPYQYAYQSLEKISIKEFKNVWAQCIEGSPNASILNIDDQMKSVEIELGASYKDSCIVVYEKQSPIGVVMPHIEAGTKSEGRLFYFGIIPSQRGKGKSKQIHKEALHMLKQDFNASIYIGATSIKNKPMIKTFSANGCNVLERNKVYKRI
ncbi:GNAT family N-acetyltransferase [Radiobacillus sp. PE A8.2]|uniref:GNAT family N-acetyltransferase n=1 Tax=Radiobacillus sp. PE A8.2 TaxID=3380349 RepID=UPI00388F8189